MRWAVQGRLPPDPQLTVLDYWDRQVMSVPLERTDGNVVRAEVKLPAGFYDLAFAPAGQRFGLVVLPELKGRPDPFFCIDAAMSWLVGADSQRADMVRILRRCAIAAARERVAWSQINQRPDQWNWDSMHRYETLRWLYADWGVGVLEMWHDAPGWTGRLGRFPADLIGLSRSWQRIIRRWRPAWIGLEIWNEPDIFFSGNLPADQYVALVRAAVWAARQAGLERPLIGGAFAHFNDPYMACAAANELPALVDVISFHTYATAMQLEPLVTRYRNWLDDTGQESMPLWITESGRPWRRGPDRPPTALDAASALDITMKAIEARACGVERYFAFVYPFYEERQDNFGMTGRRGTPLRSFAAYAQLARTLAQKHYRGDLQSNDERIKAARLFGDSDETLLLLYSGEPDGKLRVELDLPVERAEGIDGRAIAADRRGAIFLGDGLAYVWLQRGAIEGRLKREAKRMRLWRLGHRPLSRREPPLPIVLKLQPERRTLQPTTEGYRLRSHLDSFALTVRLFNLGSEPLDVAIETQVQGGLLLARTSKQPVHIEPESSEDVTWQAKLLQGPNEQSTITVRFNEKATGRDQVSVPLTLQLLRPTRSRGN